MFEHLKTSKRLQVQVALAGLALWQLKRELSRRSDRPDEPVPLTPPVNENLGEDTTIYVWPTEFDENGEPKGLEVGSVKSGEPVFGVQGVISRTRDFLIDHSSERNRRNLRSLKRQIKVARILIEDRANKLASKKS